MAYIATRRLRWGDEWIEPGETVPEDEEGRSYASLLTLGHITEVPSQPKPARKKSKPADDAKPTEGSDSTES
jgi:hypothetical protein